MVACMLILFGEKGIVCAVYHLDMITLSEWEKRCQLQACVIHQYNYS